jgi:hypothetical protein
MSVVIEDRLNSEPIVVVDKKKSIPCEYYEEFCQAEAQHMFVRTCCGREVYFCEDCMFVVLDYLKTRIPGFVCILCENSIILSKWLRYIGRI